MADYSVVIKDLPKYLRIENYNVSDNLKSLLTGMNYHVRQINLVYNSQVYNEAFLE